MFKDFEKVVRFDDGSWGNENKTGGGRVKVQKNMLYRHILNMKRLITLV